MNPYPKYKDSGEQWLGQIPEHWEMMKMKFCFLERSQKGLPKEPLLAATQNHGVILKSDYENRTVEAIKGLDSLKLVEVDDFVISLRSFQGGIERSYARGIISPAYTIIKPTHVSAGYFKYLGKSPSFISLLQNSVTGIREGQNIDYSKLKNRQIPLPPLAEQEAMVAYLDVQTGKIDAAIEREQKMIDLLEERKRIIIQQAVTKGLNPDAKMKDSGIEWIGEMPEHWDLTRLKFFLSLKSGDAIRQEQLKDVGDYPVYGGGAKIGYTNNYNAKKDEIIIGRVGAKCGCVTLLNEDSWATDNALIVKSNIDVRYLYYLLIACDLNKLNVSNAQPLITGSKIKNFHIPITRNKVEQNEIVTFLDEHLVKIDNTISCFERLIALLQERKQIIINEVVTGKIKVL